MVLFRFPFWEFLSLCEAARSLSRNCGPWLSVCLRLCTRREKKNREKKEKKKKSVKMSDAETFESNILSMFVSENSLNYESAQPSQPEPD